MSDRCGGRLTAGIEAVLVLLATSLLAHASWSTAAQTLAAPAAAEVQVERLVGLAVTAAGAVAGVWLSTWYAVCGLCLLLAGAGRRWRRLERLVADHAPRLVRRALAGALGVGLGLGVATSGAGAHTVPVDAGAPPDLGWASSSTLGPPDPEPEPSAEVSAPPRATRDPRLGLENPAGAPAIEEHENPASTTTEPASPVSVPARLTVRPGDSLWSIAARHTPDASAARTAQAWPVWYRLNADVIGADPNLIHPGQHLRIPAAGDLPPA